MNTFDRIPIMFFLLLPLLTVACEPRATGLDAQFQAAQEKAFEGKRAAARSIARNILKVAPDYHDAAILIGRTHAWDKNYPAARSQLNRVIEREPGYIDAYSALVDTELWSDHAETALKVAERGLQQVSDSEVLLYKKAEALAALNRREEAVRVLQAVLRINPEHEQAAEMLVELRAAPPTDASKRGQ